MIQVKQFYAFNDLRNYSYLIFDDQSGSCWVIDPYEAPPIIDYIKKNGLELRGILNTHQHFDHIRGNSALSETFRSPIRKLSGGESLKLDDNHELKTLDSPGHTMDHQVFVWKEKGSPFALFSGDTLFNAGVGNCRNGGNVDVLYETVEKLLSELPAQTLLYPGHDYIEKNLLFARELEQSNKTVDENLKKVRDENPEDREPRRLADEMEYNPFFRLSSEEIKENLKRELNSVEGSGELRRELFKKIRSLRDKW